MRDIELYRHLLGIDNPWTVTRVELNVPDQRVDVWAGHEERGGADAALRPGRFRWHGPGRRMASVFHVGRMCGPRRWTFTISISAA
jgi:hypothetical protein